MSSQPTVQPELRFLRMTDVQARIGLGKTEIYRMIAEGSFPRGRAYPGTTRKFWLSTDVADWQQRILAATAPVECERLQGFPDNWTLVPVKRASAARAKKLRAAPPDGSWAEIDGEVWMLAADGPRYKQIGNSMATHVMHWIGRRIDRALSTTIEGRCVRMDEFAALLAAPAPDEFSGLLAA